MSLADLANLGEAVGGFAVVLTLLYLAYELRTSTKTMRASTASQASQSWASLNESMLHDTELIALTNKLFDKDYDSESLSKEEKARLSLFCRTMMQKAEAEYFLFEAGILPESIWGGRRDNIRRWFALPGWKDWWDGEKRYSGYTKEFISELFPSSD